MFDLIFDKKAFMALKEKFDRSKYFNDGETEAINVKPGKADVPVSQKVEKGLDFVETGEKGKLEFPKVKKESAMHKEANKLSAEAENFIHAEIDKLMHDKSWLDRYEGKSHEEKLKIAEAAAYTAAREKGFEVPVKQAAQKLPGSDSIDAGGKQFMEEGGKEKLQFPSKAGPEPKIKMQGLDSSAEAKKQIDGGEKEKLQFPSSGGPNIKIEWQVNVDESIAKQFSEGGDKGDIKKSKGPAKEPGVSAQKDNGHIGKVFDSFEHTKPFQKQFSLNFARSSSAERAAAAAEAVEDAALELQIAAAKCGVNIWRTPLANAYGELLIARAGMNTHGEIYLTASAEPQEASRESLNKKYAGDMAKCISEQKGNMDDPAAFCKWVEEGKTASIALTPLKATASAHETVDDMASAAEIGRLIF